MKKLLLTLIAAIRHAIATEAGEFFSLRRKYHLLQSEMYARLANAEQPHPRPLDPHAASTRVCTHLRRRHLHSHGT